jgi:pimeloyl-ACP methyl ester carboxylesterase
MATWFDRPVVGAGVHLSCRDRGGPGAPVVLLHGLAGDAGEWDPLARRLSRCVRAVAVEQRGHGRSERYPADVSRAAWTEWERVACRTLVVLAQRSFLGAPEVEEMVRRRPRTTAVSVPGTGHDLHLERPDALHDVLAGFLTALPGIDCGAGCRSGPAPFVWGVGPPARIRGGRTP